MLTRNEAGIWSQVIRFQRLWPAVSRVPAPILLFATIICATSEAEKSQFNITPPQKKTQAIQLKNEHRT